MSGDTHVEDKKPDVGLKESTSSSGTVSNSADDLLQRIQEQIEVSLDCVNMGKGSLEIQSFLFSVLLGRY